MIIGLLLLTGTGICWAGLAAVMAAGSVRNVPASRIQPYSALLVLLCFGWMAFVFGGGLPLQKVWLQGVFLTVAGGCSYFMLNLVQKAMKSGRTGVVWAFTQSSVMWPFMMGIIFFREPLTLCRLSGLLLLICGLILFAREKESKGSKGAWLIPTVGAFLLSGFSQCCASIPSYLQISGMNALRRMMLTQCGIILAYISDSLIRGKLEFPGLQKEKAAWLLAGIFGGLNLIALLLFYSGLNILADMKCASAGYPAAQGLGVALFFLAGCRKNAPGRLSLCGFFVILTGIFLLALDAVIR